MDDQTLGRNFVKSAKEGKLNEVCRFLASPEGPRLINFQTNTGDTALIWASLKGHIDCVKLLLENPDVDVNIQSDNGSTALILAASAGHGEIISLLTERPELEINTQSTKNGYTALIWACQIKSEECVQHLLSRNDIDVNIQNNTNSQNSAPTIEIAKSTVELNTNSSSWDGFKDINSIHIEEEGKKAANLTKEQILK